jgi:hypothetical protein
VIPDSSIFLNPDQPMPEFSRNMPYLGDPLATLLSLSNKDEDVPNKACAAAFSKEQQWNCLNIYHAHRYLESESLFVQSSYDQYIFRYFAGFTCIAEGVSGFTFKNCDEKTMAVVENYRTYYL